MYACVCMEEKLRSQYNKTANGFFIIFLLASVSFQTFPVNPYHSVSGKEDGFRYVPLGLSWYYSVPMSLYIIKHLCSA